MPRRAATLTTDADFARALGAVVRSRRQARAWTAADLAARAGVHRVTVADLERGAGGSLALARRLAAALGTTAGELVAAAEKNLGKNAPGV